MCDSGSFLYVFGDFEARKLFLFGVVAVRRTFCICNGCAALSDADGLSAGEERGYAEVLSGCVEGAGELCRILPGDDSLPHLLPG